MCCLCSTLSISNFSSVDSYSFFLQSSLSLSGLFLYLFFWSPLFRDYAQAAISSHWEQTDALAVRVITFCGALRSLCTPASWLMSGMSSLKVKSGGRVGSGKLVLLNGSVSSRNCTLHTNVAMVAYIHARRLMSKSASKEPPGRGEREGGKSASQCAFIL